eukprot:5328988-Alexandrium_andersonii.AAC.1
MSALRRLASSDALGEEIPAIVEQSLFGEAFPVGPTGTILVDTPPDAEAAAATVPAPVPEVVAAAPAAELPAPE